MISEFEIIKKYLKSLSLNNLGSLNLSDDIFYDNKKKFAISVDTYVQGVHFFDCRKPKNFLKKIIRSSISDLYCKGIEPHSYFLSLSLNKKLISHRWLKEVKKVLSSEQKKYGLTLAGGDTTFSSKFSATIIVLGDTTKKPVLRSTANIDDDLYTTGNIGDSFIGLNIIKKKFNFERKNNFFKKMYYEPNIQKKIVPHLNKIASSSIDISDGFLQDLRHLCINSKCGAVIDLSLLPLSQQMKDLLKSNKINLQEVFSNGDDYQILFSSNSSKRSYIKSLSKKLNIKISRVGYMKKKRNIIIKNKLLKIKIIEEKMGYTHNF